MALLHVLTNLPLICGEICLQILDQMVAKKHFIFSTDSYHSGSIKAQERLRRGSSDRIILSGPASRNPFDSKIILANDDNKKQLCQLLLREWGDRVAASRLQRTEMAILIVEGKPINSSLRTVRCVDNLNLLYDSTNYADYISDQLYGMYI